MITYLKLKSKHFNSEFMNVSVVGTGYVGLVTGVGFALLGNRVTCVDIDRNKVKAINKGKTPIYENGLENALKKMILEKRLKASPDLKEAINDTEITFISVGTPSKKDGSIDLRFIKEVSKEIGNVLKSKKGYHVIVVKSTVVPGTTEKIVLPLIERHSAKKVGKNFGLAMNPEFLREGNALKDFLKPDRVVIGAHDKKSGLTIERLYKSLNTKILKTDLKTAEMIKYASNAFLATKITYANEIGNICKLLDIDTNRVMEAVGLDFRINPHFLRAGVGFGGSCFPKDVKALVKTSEKLRYEPKLLKNVLEINERQKVKIIELLKKRAGSLKKKSVAVLGLAFKPETDDIREAASIKIVDALLKEKAIVNVHDFKAMDNFKRIYPKINYFDDYKECIKRAGIILIVTEWDAYSKLSNKELKGKIVIEGRRILGKRKVSNFEGICW